MRAVARRIAKLENQFGPADGKPQLLAVVCHSGYDLEHDTSVPILRECGHLPGGRVGVVNLGAILDGLNANEPESFLRYTYTDAIVLHGQWRGRRLVWKARTGEG